MSRDTSVPTQDNTRTRRRPAAGWWKWIAAGAALVGLALETVFCRFNGEEADIRVVCQRAGIPIEHVAESRWLESEPSDARAERDP